MIDKEAEHIDQMSMGMSVNNVTIVQTLNVNRHTSKDTACCYISVNAVQTF